VPLVQKHFEKVVLGVIVLSLVPALLEARKARTRAAESA